MEKSAKQVYEKLIEMAQHNRVLSSYPDFRRLQDAIARGEEIPERCLPGHLLTMLSPEERKVLEGLTSDMTRSHRVE